MHLIHRGILNKKYVSGMKNEGVIGFTVGLGFVYLRILVNFQSRLIFHTRVGKSSILVYSGISSVMNIL